jgi:hypothetical protein
MDLAAWKVRRSIYSDESTRGSAHTRTVGIWSEPRGSHRQFKHGSKIGLVTVPGKPNDDLAPGTLNSILKQAGLKQ